MQAGQAELNAARQQHRQAEEEWLRERNMLELRAHKAEEELHGAQIQLQADREIAANQAKIIENQHHAYEEENRKQRAGFDKRAEEFEALKQQLEQQLADKEKDRLVQRQEFAAEAERFVAGRAQLVETLRRVSVEIGGFAELADKGAAHLAAVEREHELFKQHFSQFQEEVAAQTDTLYQTVQALIQELYQTRRERRTLDEDKTKAEAELKEVREQLRQVSAEKDAREKSLAQLEGQHRALQEKYRVAIQAHEEDRQATAAAAANEKRILTERAEALAAEVKNLESQLEVLKDQRRSLQVWTTLPSFLRPRLIPLGSPADMMIPKRNTSGQSRESPCDEPSFFNMHHHLMLHRWGRRSHSKATFGTNLTRVFLC